MAGGAPGVDDGGAAQEESERGAFERQHLVMLSRVVDVVYLRGTNRASVGAADACAHVGGDWRLTGVQ